MTKEWRRSLIRELIATFTLKRRGDAGVIITHIFETHIHADLVSGSRELCARLETAKIYASGEGGAEYGFNPEKSKMATDLNLAK